MEVLFAIGVIGIGLLGITVLLSIAGKLAGDGRTADSAARAGLNWVREFELRGYARPANWVIADPTTPYLAYQATGVSTGGPYIPAAAKSFCIDPRFAAVNYDSFFPYAATPTIPRMQRITLRSGPNAATMMSQAQADEIFLAQDDLVFDQPTDSTLLATQNYATDATPNTLKRNFDGRLSWFATVVPKMQAAKVYRDEYTLSVVVLNNRDPAMGTASLAPLRPDNERIVSVSNFYGAGIGGGDVRLSATAALDLQLKRGDWLMLAAFNAEPYIDTNGDWMYSAGEPFTDVNNDGAYTATGGLPTFRWYRVVTADEPLQNGATWTVDLTLHGPDWNSQLATTATIVTDVVTVYEKTIRLERTSLWTY